MIHDSGLLFSGHPVGFLEQRDFGKPTRTEGVWAYEIILCICELGRTGSDTGG